MGWRMRCKCGESWLDDGRHSCRMCGSDALSWTSEET